MVNNIRDEYRKNNREIIHLIPLQYKIDGSSTVENPRQMSGKSLFCRFHIISIPSAIVTNIANCLKKCQLSINNYLAESYSAALSTLTENELEFGTLTIDIGGENSSYCLIVDNKLIHAGNFAVGGSHITRDICAILNINFTTAEKIKNLNNSLMINSIEEKELIRLDTTINADIVGVTRGQLKDIIRFRIEEIIESIKENLIKNKINPFLFNNVVLTGGCGAIVGIDKLCAKILKKNVRIAIPNNIEDLPQELKDSTFASACGMLIFLKDHHVQSNNTYNFDNRRGFFGRIIDRLLSI